MAVSLGRALSDEADLASAPTDNLAPRSKQLSEPGKRRLSKCLVAQWTDRTPPCNACSLREYEADRRDRARVGRCGLSILFRKADINTAVTCISFEIISGSIFLEFGC